MPCDFNHDILFSDVAKDIFEDVTDDRIDLFAVIPNNAQAKHSLPE